MPFEYLSSVSMPLTGLPGSTAWLSSLHPIEVYTAAVATVTAILALGMWLASFRVDRLALRLFALRYAVTVPRRLFAHPLAHGGPTQAPFLSMVVALVLQAMTFWALDTFVGTASRRRAVAAGVVLAIAIAVLALMQWWLPGSALGIYTLMGLGMAYCAGMAARAARRDPGVGLGWLATAFASYPLLLLASPLWSMHVRLDLAT